MCLEGDYRLLQDISLGENLYLLMRKLIKKNAWERH